jgi:hypothetical protein
MPEKMLTSIERQVTEQTVQQTVAETITEALYTAKLEAQFIDTFEKAKGFQTFYQQQLQHVQIMTQIMHYFVPTLPLSERRETLYDITQPLLKEEKALLKHLLKYSQYASQQRQKRDLTRLERYEQETQERLLPTIALNLIDHTALCILDKELWQTYPTQVQQILQQIKEMCEKKTFHITPLPDYIALQEHLLQTYSTAHATHPFLLNMLAMRLTAMSMQVLKNIPMTIYYVGAVQQQMMQCKYQLTCCENRRLETKYVSSGKPTTEAVPEKYSVGWTPKLTGDEKVGIPKNMKGQELIFMALRYAYSMPYWIRRMIAIHTGMPENSKYALYFGIGGLPTRRSTWRYDFLKYPEAKYLQYSADEHIRKLIQKYSAKRAYFYKRYGRYYRKRRV